MDTSTEAVERNGLLSAIAKDAMSALRPLLEPVVLAKNSMLSTSGKVPEFCYFLEGGIASIIMTTSEGRSCEVGIVGREGAAPIAGLLTGQSAPFDAVMQVEGYALRARTKNFRPVLLTHPAVSEIMYRYAQSFLVQTASTALANANYSVEERLARWILMCHDRIDGDRVSLTHEFLSLMLAVRRPSVTTALHVLEGRRLIHSERSLVVVRDRRGLEQFCQGCYGQAESAYRDLVATLRPNAPS